MASNTAQKFDSAPTAAGPIQRRVAVLNPQEQNQSLPLEDLLILYPGLKFKTSSLLAAAHALWRELRNCRS